MQLTQQDEAKYKLLHAAGRVFALHGYNKATIREICDVAGVNVAAVSYHFGGKEKLYVDVLQHFLKTGERMVPRGRDDVAQDVPEERLRIFVRHLLAILAGEREADAEGLSWLLLQECLEPMSVAEELLHSYFATKRAQLVDIVSQMHPGCSTGLARRMSASVIWQCLLFAFARGPVGRRCVDAEFCGQGLDEMCEFVVGFCAGGMNRLEGGWRGDSRPSELPTAAGSQA